MANQQLPQPTGPYTVGVWAYDVIDPNQTDTINPEGRPIPIHFYFPLAHGLHTLQKKLPELRAPHKNPALHTETYAMLAETSRMAPGIRNLVIFNHGNTIPMTEDRKSVV